MPRGDMLADYKDYSFTVLPADLPVRLLVSFSLRFLTKLAPHVNRGSCQTDL